MKMRTLIIATFIAVATLATACANDGYRPASSTSLTSSSSSVTYGVIESIETVPGDSGGIAGSGIGAGTIIGGVAVVGHQFGGGIGQDIATAAGLVGGVVVGHEIDKGNQQQDVYSIRVRTDSGGYQTLTQQSIKRFARR